MGVCACAHACSVCMSVSVDVYMCMSGQRRGRGGEIMFSDAHQTILSGALCVM